MSDKNCCKDYENDKVPSIEDGMCCIDANRIFDCCRKKLYLNNIRVMLNDQSQAVLNSGTNARIKDVSVIWCQISSSDLPYNCGYYQVNTRYFFNCIIEVCRGLGDTVEINGLAYYDDSSVLYGGEGNVSCFKSTVSNGFCSMPNPCDMVSNLPSVAIEVAEPIPLKLCITDTNDCCRPQSCGCDSIPEQIERLYGKLSGKCCPIEKEALISIGLFSVIRMERPSQIIVPACDFCIPDERNANICPGNNPEDLFDSMAFPLNEFYPDARLCDRKKH
ncbi:MAG: hypothetical protein PUB08_06630 [Firmicutes bacterium]|nr:hypothetical protein [Bacillota bacterium]